MYPVLFQLGSLQVSSFGVMIALGTIAAMIISYKRSPADNLTSDLVFEAIIVIGFCSLLTSWILHFIFNVNLLGVSFVLQGLSLYGVVIGCVIGLIVWSRFRKVNAIKMGDFLSPYFALIYSFSKVGCYLNGCCYGLETSLSWAVSYPHMPGLLLHPVQLYAAIGSAVIFIFLLILQAKKPFVGSVMIMFLFMFGSLLIITGIFYFSAVNWFGMSPVQLFGLLLIISAIVLVVYLYQAGSKKKSSRNKENSETNKDVR